MLNMVPGRRLSIERARVITPLSSSILKKVKSCCGRISYLTMELSPSSKSDADILVTTLLILRKLILKELINLVN